MWHWVNDNYIVKAIFLTLNYWVWDEIDLYRRIGFDPISLGEVIVRNKSDPNRILKVKIDTN